MGDYEYPERGMFEDRAAPAARQNLEKEISELERRIAKNPFNMRARKHLEAKKKALRAFRMDEAGMFPGGIEKR